MKALFAQPIGRLDEVTSGSVSNTITSSANTIQLSISDRLSLMFQSTALLISAYAIAFRYSWALTLVTSSAILFIIIVYSFSTPIVIKAHHAVEKADEKHASIAGEIFGSIRTVFSLGAERPLTKRYCNWVEISKQRGKKLAPLYGAQLAPVYFAMQCSFALAFWFGLQLYRQGHISSVSTVITVFFSILIVVMVAGNIVQPFMNIVKAVSTSVQFFRMIDSDKLDYTGLRDPDVTALADIEFRDVKFSYPSRPGVQVIKGLNATFQQGKTTAIVGPSGSGKSTVVGLVERWYELSQSLKADVEVADETKLVEDKGDETRDTSKELVRLPNEGSISIGGINVDTVDLKWWRAQIGLVQQEPFLFNDTIYNNVRFGLLGTEMMHYSDEKIRELVQEACVEAFADDFIQHLPKKYDTLVGEGGLQLSGGQRQRVAIARSIVRRPVILILDEATSSIDVRAEAIVQQALERVSKNRTTIVIAHRLSTIRKADHIIVIRDGIKQEEGTHEELVSIEDGLYSGLVNAQKLEEQTAGEEATDDEKSKEVALTRTVSSRDTRFAATEEEKTKEFKKRGFFGSVGLFLYEQRQHWVFYAMTLASAAVAGSVFALQSFFFAHLVEAFQYTGRQLAHAQHFWALMFFILALVVAVAYFMLGLSSTMFASHLAANYRREYFANLLAKPVRFFDQENNESGSLMSKLSTDPKQLQQLLGFEGAFPLIAIFNLIGSISISFAFGWKLTLVVLFSAMPVILLASFFRMQWEVKFEEENSKIFANSSRFATEAIGAFRTVCSLTMEDTIIDKYHNLLQSQIRNQVRTASYATLVFAFIDSAELACMALAFWYGGQLLSTREYDVVQFFVIYVAIVQGGQASGQFFSFAPNLAQTKQAANRIIQAREPDESVAQAKLEVVPSTSDEGESLGAKVEFVKVTHKYAARETPTFINLSLSVPAGSFVALVGASGSGKTSCISLLERFYDPVSGTITMNDTDITTLNITAYRQQLSLVAQEPRLFGGTIKENLLLAVDETVVTDEEIHQACKDAEIHDFILSLPEGYDTELGINTQTALSGGQKQRLCLARALLRKPKLLLLDEATSSLDSQSEKLVQAAIERLAGQRSMTVIAVAHRLATIQKADKIFVFSEGEEGKGSRILESGTHSELLRRRGAYWTMCRGQALDR
jgi:ATP-binding cassette, subfamily B (MDR/TAP), member 1